MIYTLTKNTEQGVALLTRVQGKKVQGIPYYEEPINIDGTKPNNNWVETTTDEFLVWAPEDLDLLCERICIGRDIFIRELSQFDNLNLYINDVTRYARAYPDKIKAYVYENINLDGKRGVSVKITSSKEDFNESHPNLDTYAFEANKKVFQIHFDPANPLHTSIISTLEWKE